MKHSCFLAFSVALMWGATALADLENHYNFDTEATLTDDSSGNGRSGFLDDLEVGWVDDEVRGGVLELGGNTNGFIVAPTVEEMDTFTIMMWAYRDPEFAGGAGGANDGLFQLALANDDLEFLPPPPTAGTAKVVGGWVQKADNIVWGRVNDEGGTWNLDKVYAMEDEEWVHLAYRGNGEEFDLLVNGEVETTIEYDGSLVEFDSIYIGRQGTETWGGRLDDFRIYSNFVSEDEIKAIMTGAPQGLLGDFDNSGELDVADIDMLTADVIAGNNTASFDLDNNAAVNAEDRRVWIEDLRNTYFGDANLDGEFNSSDFVAVFGAAKYETGEAATWGEGDWNGDAQFNSSDFVSAFSGGGYEKGPRPAAAVPEPSSLNLAVVAILGLMAKRRR
ncbi:MAG: hypothetical protein KDB27_03865 [Planctomycetales bacterium]|nr:hypothetical protein [Planctomycetales bacterium]